MSNEISLKDQLNYANRNKIDGHSLSSEAAPAPNAAKYEFNPE